MSRPPVVAVVGATGAVGGEMLRLLDEGRLAFGALRPLASARSVGRMLRCAGRDWAVAAPSREAFAGVGTAFFDAGAPVSREWVPVARAAGAVCIDMTSAFRLDPAVPLVVPEVNGHLLDARPGLVAGPNCTVAGLVVAVAPLARAAGAVSMRVASYQAVSGAGARGIFELEGGGAPAVFPRPIARNVIPQVGAFETDGYTDEERKIEAEARRLLDLPALRLSATCVRVPVVRGHSLAVWLQTERPLPVSEARRILASAPGVRLEDDPAAGRYPTPLDAAGADPVWIGRVRPDPTVAHGLALWIVSDNLRKGAALNAVQIALRLAASGVRS